MATKNFIFLLFYLLTFFAFLSSDLSATEEVVLPNAVYVLIIDTQEEEFIQLRRGQKGSVKVYLSSLGDSVEKYLVELFERDKSVRVGFGLSDVHGTLTFKDLLPGRYVLVLNERVRKNSDRKTVKLADMVLTAYP